MCNCHRVSAPLDVAKHFRVKSTPTILLYVSWIEDGSIYFCCLNPFCCLFFYSFKEGIRYTFDHPVVSTDNLVEFMTEIML